MAQLLHLYNPTQTATLSLVTTPYYINRLLYSGWKVINKRLKNSNTVKYLNLLSSKPVMTVTSVNYF